MTAEGTVIPLHRRPAPIRSTHRRVLIADADGLARRMAQNTLNTAERSLIVLTARDRRETLELARYYQPELVLIDTALPPHGCLDTVRELVQLNPHTHVLTVAAGHSADQTALAAIRAGAAGHIDKEIDPSELGRLVELAIGGEAVLPRRLIAPLITLLHETPDTGWRPLHSRLTTREWQVVELLDHGATTEQIARRLVLSNTTVYSHVQNVMRKLGVHTRHEIAQAAEQLRQDESLMRKTLTPTPPTSSPPDHTDREPYK